LEIEQTALRAHITPNGELLLNLSAQAAPRRPNNESNTKLVEISIGDDSSDYRRPKRNGAAPFLTPLH